MPSWDSYSYAFAPATTLLALLVIILLLRWTFSSGGSLVARRSAPGAVDEYGLLVPVASPATYVEAELLRQRLMAHDIRATLAPTTVGPRVMVWPKDVEIAREVLRAPA